jgi:hypothetical protein
MSGWTGRRSLCRSMAGCHPCRETGNLRFLTTSRSRTSRLASGRSRRVAQEKAEVAAKKSARTEKNPDADRQMKIAESILGTYRLPSSIAPGDELIHIGSEGRFVHFMYMSAAAKRMQAIAFWAERVDDDHYRTRPKPDNRWGVVSRWVPTPTGMRIERAEIAFELTRMDESELPEWYAERLAKALEKMSKREEELGKKSDGPGT